MIDVPAATPVTTPVDGLIVATAGVAEVQAPPVTVELSVEVPFEQIAVVPESVPAEGAVVTVTVLVAVAFAHPPVPVMVYVMMDVPAATPVTTPVDELIVATAGVAEVQAPPVTVELSVEEPLEQIAVVPESVPAEGAAVTVTVLVAVAFAQPPVPVMV
jgi:hypothetical protein